MRRFKIIEGDMESKVSERRFTGRITKGRYKIIMSKLRRDTVKYGNFHCGHEHDCCGCLVSNTFEFQYSKNQVVITNYTSFNY